ncbi:myb-related transcription factor, partner of profilin-like [Tachysurus ichikawai]
MATVGGSENYSILFGGHSSEVTNIKKQCEWQSIASAINCVRGTERTVAELKKKWSDLKVQANKIAAIIWEVSVCGIVSEKEGDTDVTETTEEQVLPESEAVDAVKT